MEKKKKYSFLVALVIIALVGFIYSSLNVFTAINSIEQVLRIINDNYVNDVDITELLERAIEAIVDTLDSHSSYLKEKDFKDLMIHTEGEFGGLGIQVSKRGEYITIIAPIEGTPAYEAGLLQGDKIIKIDGISTKDMDLDKAVSMMRGAPGTKVTLTISREGMDKPIDYTIVRAIIKIKSVPYAGLIKPNIGYIAINSFSKTTPNELKVVLDSLIDLGANKFILDLRNNPGGILDVAAKVASFFIEKKKEIVYTEGKNTKDFYYSDDGAYSEYPLVVLVSSFSASGSEIVAGAIQDWDRGLLIGSRTFGKGSVQRIYRLPGNRALKLTIARYHTPSGRCIDRELVKDTTRIYYTKGPLHRKVKGGGGIVPDSVLEIKYSPFFERIYRYSFDFVVEYLAKHPGVEEVTPSMIEAFKSKVKESLKKDSLEFAENIEFLKNFPDTVKLTEDVSREILRRVKEYLQRETGKPIGFSEEEWDKSLNEIKRELKIRVAYNKKGIKGRYEASIPEDEHIQVALKILKTAKTPKDVFSLKR
ncbi:MAG: S41 family peptidase [candidate division WOR-3 bacterium]